MVDRTPAPAVAAAVGSNPATWLVARRSAQQRDPLTPAAHEQPGFRNVVPEAVGGSGDLQSVRSGVAARRAGRTGVRMGTMSRRRFSELTKHFSPQRRVYIEAGKARIREEVTREKADREGREAARRDPGTSPPALRGDTAKQSMR